MENVSYIIGRNRYISVLDYLKICLYKNDNELLDTLDCANQFINAWNDVEHVEIIDSNHRTIAIVWKDVKILYVLTWTDTKLNMSVLESYNDLSNMSVANVNAHKIDEQEYIILNEDKTENTPKYYLLKYPSNKYTSLIEFDYDEYNNHDWMCHRGSFKSTSMFRNNACDNRYTYKLNNHIYTTTEDRYGYYGIITDNEEPIQIPLEPIMEMTSICNSCGEDAESCGYGCRGGYRQGMMPKYCGELLFAKSTSAHLLILYNEYFIISFNTVSMNQRVLYKHESEGIITNVRYYDGAVYIMIADIYHNILNTIKIYDIDLESRFNFISVCMENNLFDEYWAREILTYV